ncbi:MAG: periplasmic heavy metal sensor [Bryobacteraceae bacterium]|nr:periplasmic heavy metal sensor [Bryobacteraceae bacterium]MDW8379820.1 periplasmic heavy metal sensor [Bryobacterales bacterium]
MRLALLLLMPFASLAPAQTPGRELFPWWDMPVVRDLNLSEEQMRQIRATAREYRDRIIDLRASMEKADNELNDLMEEEKPDQQKLFAAIDRLVAARGELTRVFSQMAVKMRLVLTPQQWKELQRRRPRPFAPPNLPRPNLPPEPAARPPRPAQN